MYPVRTRSLALPPSPRETRFPVFRVPYSVSLLTLPVDSVRWTERPYRRCGDGACTSTGKDRYVGKAAFD